MVFRILFSKFILKTLRGYALGNLSLFCQYGTRLVLIFQSCEQLKTRVSVRTLVWFTAPVYLFLYLIVSHVSLPYCHFVLSSCLYMPFLWNYLFFLLVRWLEPLGTISLLNDNFHAGTMPPKLLLNVSFPVMAPLDQHWTQHLSTSFTL